VSLVERRISDRRVLKLIGKWRNAGVLENGAWSATEMGSPQGGVISPLLATIYLHVLDMYWTERYASLGKLVRYADDFVRHEARIGHGAKAPPAGRRAGSLSP
jgi:retron-type reverse transcriptase